MEMNGIMAAMASRWTSTEALAMVMDNRQQPTTTRMSERKTSCCRGSKSPTYIAPIELAGLVESKQSAAKKPDLGSL